MSCQSCIEDCWPENPTQSFFVGLGHRLPALCTYCASSDNGNPILEENIYIDKKSSPWEEPVETIRPKSSPPHHITGDYRGDYKGGDKGVNPNQQLKAQVRWLHKRLDQHVLETQKSKKPNISTLKGVYKANIM